MTSHRKVKSVAKIMVTEGESLDGLVLDTMKQISQIVGSTLGPGGKVVAIERQEFGVPDLVTKDGVTVFRALGYDNPVRHSIMTLARDASVRTATEAGDGPQPLYSKVLTPDGYVRMEDIKVGMTICGSNGTTQKVLGVYPKGKKRLVKVSFSGNKVVECCEDHLWSVVTNRGSHKTLTTREIAKDFKTQTGEGYNKYKYYVPKAGPVMFRDNATPLDPYLVGVLLGDGSLSDTGSVELSLGKSKEHVIKKVESKLPQGLFLKTTWVDERNSFRVKIQGVTSEKKTIRDLIETVGIRNQDSYSKSIPSEYLLGSVTSRKELLQGLIDTDGYVNPRGLFEFSTVGDKLAVDFFNLCESLGISLYYRIHTRDQDPDSFSDTPIHRFHELRGDKYGDKIIDVEVTDRFEEMQCIKVSNEDSLYITDGCVLTHNTTTATVLAEAFVRRTYNFCKDNPKISPQRVVRAMEKVFRTEIEPFVKSLAIKPDGDLLKSVAMCSTNGDVELTEAVAQCFELTGDEGNVTLTEQSGPSGYKVEALKGYPISTGFEDCVGKYFSIFMNDAAHNRVYLEKPVFVLYNGSINDWATVVPILTKIGERWGGPEVNKATRNVVVVATAFSQQAIEDMAGNWSDYRTINVFPLTLPRNAMQSGQLDLLHDLSAVTGSVVFDPVTRPAVEGTLEDIGPELEFFESTRYRTSVVGHADEGLVLARVEEIEAQIPQAESQVEQNILNERRGKISGGIAKLIISAPTSGELREKRDRAEDAACAWRGAVKHGALPGGGWTLLKTIEMLVTNYSLTLETFESQVVKEVLCKSLVEPVERLLRNCGYTDEEIFNRMEEMKGLLEEDEPVIFDALDSQFKEARGSGVVDSLPAVLEAVRNSISIASQLGTLGGVVVFPRDTTLERSEAEASYDYYRNSGMMK